MLSCFRVKISKTWLLHNYDGLSSSLYLISQSANTP
jgi:hypothetical protein